MQGKSVNSPKGISEGTPFIDDLRPGLISEKTITVTGRHLAPHVAVLSTPSLLGFFESTAANTIRAYLPSDAITVGFEVRIRHFLPVAEGSQVTVKAEVLDMKGNKISFGLEAYSDGKKIGEGTLRSAVVPKGFEAQGQKPADRM